MGSRAAMDVALAMFRRPALVRTMQKAPLPEGIITVIRIAAGEDEEARFISPRHSRNAEEAREAAVFFLQQILFHPRSDSYRLLGLGAGAGMDQVTEHKRWLLKWLHPDRNHNKWESALFQRVVKAAEELEKRSASATVRVEPKRVRRHSRRRLEQFAARRVRKLQNWHERLAKYRRRFAVSAAVVLFGVLAWSSLTSRPLGSAFASLTEWPQAWLRW